MSELPIGTQGPASLSDRQTRQAFLRTARSVVDYRGQAVSGLSKIHVSYGLPTHGYAARDAVPGSRLEALAGVGHFPHVEAPTAVVDILDDFIATTGRHAESDKLTSTAATIVRRRT